MAIKDLYKNKLTKSNANIANGLVGSNSTRPNLIDGSDSPRPTATTVDGSGRPYSVERFGYNPDYQNLKNKPKTTPTTTQNSVEQNVVSSNPTWKDYADLINAKTANSKVELQTAMQRAQSASNDYLKALGLQGSGLGQSQLTDIGAQYQNALSNVNRQAESDVNTQLDNDFREMVDNGASSQDIENYIKQYGEQTGLTNSWNNYVQQVGANFDSSVKNIMEDLNDMQNNDSYKTVNGIQMKLNNEQKEYAGYVQRMIDNAISSGNKDEVKRVLEKYNKFLNNPESLTNKDIYDMDVYILNNPNKGEEARKMAMSASSVSIGNRNYKYVNGEWKRI